MFAFLFTDKSFVLLIVHNRKSTYWYILKRFSQSVLVCFYV